MANIRRSPAHERARAFNTNDPCPPEANSRLAVSAMRRARQAQIQARKRAQNSGRETSPGKNVHFPKGGRLISGPSGVSPELRAQSPTRSALKPVRGVEEDESESMSISTDEDDHHGRSAQSEDDMCRSIDEPLVREPPPRRASILTQQAPATGSRVSKRFAEIDWISSDEDLCVRLDVLKKGIQDFVSDFPTRPKVPQNGVLIQLLQPENEQLVRYIGCLAQGGRDGKIGWDELLHNDMSRRSIVWAVVAKVLKENAFDELYFGAWPELETKLREMERKQAVQDGFYRQRMRGLEIHEQTQKRSKSEDQDSLYKAIARVTLGLEHLIMPLWTLDDVESHRTWIEEGMRARLFAIVEDAAKTARAMRATQDVIYYWPPTFKDEEFEPAVMECLNLNDMIRNSPYDRQEVRGQDRPILREGHDRESQAIVRIVCFPGIQAYRQGGGELAKEQLAAERNGGNADNAPPDVLRMRRKVTNRYGEEYTGKEGIRTRIVSKSVVLLQWGTQRLLTKEAGTSRHLDAVKAGKLERYTRDVKDCVELYALFKHRTGMPKTSPTEGLQRPPSFFGRVIASMMGGEPEETEDEIEVEVDESQLPTAEYNKAWESRKAGRRGVGAPSSPRSRKTRAPVYG